LSIIELDDVKRLKTNSVSNVYFFRLFMFTLGGCVVLFVFPSWFSYLLLLFYYKKRIAYSQLGT